MPAQVCLNWAPGNIPGLSGRTRREASSLGQHTHSSKPFHTTMRSAAPEVPCEEQSSLRWLSHAHLGYLRGSWCWRHSSPPHKSPQPSPLRAPRWSIIQFLAKKNHPSFTAYSYLSYRGTPLESSHWSDWRRCFPLLLSFLLPGSAWQPHAHTMFSMLILCQAC